jgi:hydrogenase expression/formation protein HypE
MADKSKVGIVLDEASVPVRPRSAPRPSCSASIRCSSPTKGRRSSASTRCGEAVLAALRSHPVRRDGRDRRPLLEDAPGSVVVDTGFGRRFLSEPDGELLPRIC